MFAYNRRNSRIAIIAVVLFLVFDFVALTLNYWLSWKIEKQAIAINLAGRQRMLSQRMVKILLQLDHSRLDEQLRAKELQELRVTFDLFDDTLQGFAKGHTTKGGANEELFLEPVKGDAAQKFVASASALWVPYRTLVLDILNAPPDSRDESIRLATDYAEHNNLEVLDLMNQLTTELELLTKHETQQIRLYQGSAFAFAMLNFIGALMIYVRRMRAMSRSHTILDDIINNIAASVMVVDTANVVLKANQTTEKLFGYGTGELLGLHETELVKGEQDKIVASRKDGSTFPASMERSEIMLDGQKLYIDTIIDVTRQRMTEEHLTSLAYHDLLTGLPNRLLFDDRLQVELAHAQRQNKSLGVLFVDLDKFKPVNDTYGHEIGDLLLQDVTVRLKRCLRETDTVSRRGGDEFTIILSEIGGRNSCERVAQTILSQLGRPFMIQNLELKIGASIGISLYPNDGNDAHLLVSRADEAMYQAKQTGRNKYVFYSDKPV